MRTHLVLPSVLLPLFITAACDGNGGNPGNDGGTALGCEIDGVELPLPGLDAVRDDGEPADRTCVGNPTAASASTAVTLEGCLGLFGLEGTAKAGLRVSVFSADQDPSSATPDHGSAEVAVAGDGSALADEANACPSRGYYRIEGVPTNTPLIVRLRDESLNKTIVDSYAFNVMLLDDDVTDGTAVYEPRMILGASYQSIPLLGGQLVDGQVNLTDNSGRGVIAGEVHDCADVRVVNAVVSTSGVDGTTRVTYFNGDEESPSPEIYRAGTNTDARFLVLNANTAPGASTHVVAAVLSELGCADSENCQCLSMGTATVTAFPDSVSLVTIRGDLPVIADE